MYAREALFSSELFGDDLAKLLPVIDQEGSDSSMFDNCFEFLTLAGRSLPHTAMMMIPEPWQKHAGMSEEKRAFYEYHSCLMEPWDGPSTIAFTDGDCRRRRTRPQWLASLTLLHHQRRPGGHGLRSGGARSSG